MNYICCDCGNIFEDGEEKILIEPHGEVFKVCPKCQGDYEETVRCEKCYGEFRGEELTCGLCEDCIDEYRYDIDTCYSIGEKEPESIELNSFLVSMFDQNEIEQILLREIKKSSLGKVDCSKFIDSDKDWFAEKLLEEGV